MANIQPVGAVTAAPPTTPAPRRPPEVEVATTTSTIISAVAAPMVVPYVTKPERDAVFQEIGLRVGPDEMPIPPIALQIAAERRAGVAHSHNRLAAVSPAEATAKPEARRERSGLDVLA